MRESPQDCVAPVTEPDDGTCCLAGDIIVSQVYHGWTLGAIVRQNDGGIQWSFIAIFADFESAHREARDLARANGVGAWHHQGGTAHRRIRL